MSIEMAEKCVYAIFIIYIITYFIEQHTNRETILHKVIWSIGLLELAAGIALCILGM